MKYTIDPVTLNLTRRQKWSNNSTILLFTEDFTYDPLDRLKEWKVTNSQDNSQVYTVNYSLNGNITHKSDMGLYAYNPSTPNAVEYIHSLEGDARSVADNHIAYNLFNKTSEMVVIQNDIEKSNYTITYGPDDQRKKSILTTNSGGSTFTTIYSGLFEERSNGERLYHISTPAGIAALVVTN